MVTTRLEFARVCSTPAAVPKTNRLRLALLNTTAVGVLILAGAGHADAAPDACTTSGTTVTCTGDQSAGIASGTDFTVPPVDTVNVQDLTVAITPGAGTDGVGITVPTGNDIGVNVDSGAYGITTTGVDAQGISVVNSGNGNVTISNTGNVSTAGALSHGVFGRVYGTGNVTITSTGDVTTSGDVADGFDGIANIGDVSITSTGNVITSGDGARGIFSITNTGNVSITSAGNVTTSGDGARGIFSITNTGNVSINSTGNVSTSGNDTRATAIYGFATTGNVSITSMGNVSTTQGMSAAVSGVANNAGNVNVTSTGNVSTMGAYSGGIYGKASTGDVIIISSGTVSTQGNFSGGLDGRVLVNGNVSIASSGDISTQGGSAIGILGSAAGNLNVTSVGDISTVGDGSFGILGLASGVGNVTLTSSGDIATQGAGARGISGFLTGTGNVTITSNGNVSTQGDGGYGLRGYVGGTGDVNITSNGNISTQGNLASGVHGYVTGTGNVTISSTGNISTQGNGLFARGLFGYVIGTGDINISSSGNITTLGGAAAGIAGYIVGTGNITLTSSGDISTQSAYSRGIFAGIVGNGNINMSSVGGISTAGYGADGIFANLLGSGEVAVTSTGNILATGTSADGINAIVTGAGNIVVTSSGNITATGLNAHGVQANVTAGSAATVNLLGGTVQGGTGTAAGVTFASAAGATNVLNTSGTVSMSSLAGIAVSGGAGNTTINNSGTLNTLTNGAINLGTGSNAFNNMAGGTFNAGAVVNLGAGNLFTNDGTLSAGGSGAVGATAITGNVVQNSGGTLLSTIDQTANTSDLVTVSGTGSLAGNVQIQVINPNFGMQTHTIFSAAGGTMDNGFSLLASPALQATLTNPNANDVVVTTNLDYTAPGQGLTANQANLTGNLNQIATVGGGGVASILLALLNGTVTLSDYQKLLNELLPEVALNGLATTLAGAEGFASNMLSCGQPGTGNDFIAEGQCIWGRMNVGSLDRDSTSGTIGYEETAQGIAMGAQGQVAPNWYVGGAFGLSASDLETDTNAQSDGVHAHIGGVVKFVDGPLVLATGLSGGISSFDTSRRVSTGGLALTATGDHDTLWLGGQFRAAWLLDQGSWYVKPLVDVNVTYLDRDGFTEEGGGAANLAVQGDDETYLSATPAVEIGWAFTADDITIKPFIKTGVSFMSEDSSSLTASFANAPAGTSSFATSSEVDNVLADVEVGFTLFKSDGSSLTLGYEGLYGEDTQGHGGFLKGRMSF